ncbi:hypothetical protein CPB85DRAFT_439940 [Mucidula mucida]|nr:hypothetical protein CPB85DRAFT_439940 [Mucidula mucida]
MPSPHRPMAFYSVDKYSSHYPSTPQGSPGRPLPPSSMVSNSPVPPITSPSMWPSNQYSSSSFYGSTNPDTVLSPFNYSQGSFGSDSIGSQNPSPAALPPSSFNGDSPAPRSDLFLNDMNEGHAIEQPPPPVIPLAISRLFSPTCSGSPRRVVL